MIICFSQPKQVKLAATATASSAQKMSGRESRSREQKKVYAFGSSTPRYLEYLDHIPRQYRVYNVKLRSRAKTTDPERRTLAEYMSAARTSPTRAGGRDRSLDSSSAGGRYAFGSRTPRHLSYLDHIPSEYRVYDVRLEAVPAGMDGEKRSKTTASFMPSSKPALHSIARAIPCFYWYILVITITTRLLIFCDFPCIGLALLLLCVRTSPIGTFSRGF